MKYIMTKWGEFAVGSSQPCDTWRQIDENGLYDPGRGSFLWKAGKNVISLDGKAQYENERRRHPSRINGVQSGSGFTLSTGKGVTYGIGASVFGISIQASTNHSTMVAQSYKAGSSHFRTHFVWGNDGNLADNPEVEYSF